MFENRMLRTIFGPKRDEVIGGRRKLHNEVHHNLYSSPSTIKMIKSRMMRLGRACSRHEKQRNAYRISVGKQVGKRPLRRPRRKWADNNEMDIIEIGWDGMDLLIWLRIGTSGGLL
jgi:hypothetical protein